LGAQTGGKSAAIAKTLIETTKPGGVDPRSWLAGILARIADHRINRIKELLPWNSRQPRSGRALSRLLKKDFEPAHWWKPFRFRPETAR